MRALQPREVRCSDILIIAEQEWVSGVVVADVGPATIDLERWNATLESIWPIGAGNLQNVQTEVRTDIEAFRAQSCRVIADVCVQHDIRSERVSAAETEEINQARSRTQLPAIQSWTADFSKYRRVDD